MKLFDSFLKKKVSVDEMVDNANRWTNLYMNQYSIRDNTDIKNGIYLFNTWVIWTHCLQNNLIDNPKGCHRDFLANVLVFLMKTKDISGERFLSLYQDRFSLYQKEIRGLKEPQFYPFGLYSAICKNQYSLNQTINMEDIFRHNESDDFIEFTDKFIKFWNVINSELLTKYK